jgi:putative spermidine/putrescine transport system permease protein
MTAPSPAALRPTIPGPGAPIPRDRRPRWIAAAHALFVAAAAVIALLPFVPLVLWSVAFSWRFPSLLPSAWSTRAWQYLVTPASKMQEAIVASTLIALVVTALSIAIAIPAGRALGLHRFRGKTFVEFLLLAPVIMPGIAVAMGIHIVFAKLGLADTVWGVVLVHLVPTTPYAVSILTGVFANYDADFEDQARVLGASPARAFRHVTLPMILPGAAVAALFAFLISWSQYVLTLLIGGGRVITMPLLLFSFARSGDNAVAAALCLVFLGPALLILLLTTRYLSGGARVGGVRKL